MLKKQLVKKVGWITMLTMPTIYIPSVIAYKTIHYINSGVDIVADELVDGETDQEVKLNINDYLGVLDIGPLNEIDTFNIVERINLIKNTNFDYREFETKIIDNNIAELTIKKESEKYVQDEIVLIKFKIQDDNQLEFGTDSVDINFSLFEKINIVKFDQEYAYIDKDSFEMTFNKKFLKLEPLAEKIEIRFSYDRVIRPQNVKAIYVGFTSPFEWCYSIH